MASSTRPWLCSTLPVSFLVASSVLPLRWRDRTPKAAESLSAGTLAPGGVPNGVKCTVQFQPKAGHASLAWFIDAASVSTRVLPQAIQDLRGVDPPPLLGAMVADPTSLSRPTPKCSSTNMLIVFLRSSFCSSSMSTFSL